MITSSLSGCYQAKLTHQQWLHLQLTVAQWCQVKSCTTDQDLFDILLHRYIDKSYLILIYQYFWQTLHSLICTNSRLLFFEHWCQSLVEDSMISIMIILSLMTNFHWKLISTKRSFLTESLQRCPISAFFSRVSIFFTALAFLETARPPLSDYQTFPLFHWNLKQTEFSLCLFLGYLVSLEFELSDNEWKSQQCRFKRKEMLSKLSCSSESQCNAHH